MALNITNIYAEYEESLKKALTCQWCQGRLKATFAECHNCGGQNMNTESGASITAGSTYYQEPRNFKINHQETVFCVGGSGGAGGAGVVVEYNAIGYGGGAGIHVTSSKK